MFHTCRCFVFMCCFLANALMIQGIAFASHGASIDGELKYSAGFDRFPYTSKDAHTGGRLVLDDIGSYDKLNPYTLKGIAPLGMSELVFESLAVSSLDEPFSKYGLLAKDIEIADDHKSMTVTLDENAMFSDGSPVRPEDVSFSLSTMKSDRVHPFYASYYKDIIDCVPVGNNAVRFTFARKNRELPLIALEFPIFSQKFYNAHTFGEESMDDRLVGSGPYVIDTIRQGKSITYKRNPAYWARNKNVRKGMFNFDEITVKYFKDETVALEAFKAGEFDVQFVNIAKQWVRDLTGPKFKDGSLLKKEFPHSNNTGMQCFVFNTRKPLFADIRVRKALNIALNFEWINESLFYGLYKRNESFFSNSYLAAKGVPKGLELQYLEQYKDQLPPEVFTTPLHAATYKDNADTRRNLTEAKNLLTEAGWHVKNGKLVNEEGQEFVFEIMLASATFNRVVAPFVSNLKRLGITVHYRTVDPALYQERIQTFDFDMIVHSFGQSQSPGNEQRDYWTSAAANVKGSSNLCGIQSPVVDALVDRIIYSQTREEMQASVSALDRVLWYGYYVIPQWHSDRYRLAYAKKFNYPLTLPLYYNYFQLLMTWWQE